MAQISADSSTDGYRLALLSGVRMVEVDIWDGEDGEPVVTHGHTFATDILFKEAIQTIHEHAFVASPYPVIIALANNCTPEMQQMCADILIEELGDKLFRQECKHLPNPEELKYKIILRGKHETHFNSRNLAEFSDTESDSEIPEVLANNKEKRERPAKLVLHKSLSDLMVCLHSKAFQTFR